MQISSRESFHIDSPLEGGGCQCWVRVVFSRIRMFSCLLPIGTIESLLLSAWLHLFKAC